jgi:CheY-like chemotaxis protein
MRDVKNNGNNGLESIGQSRKIATQYTVREDMKHTTRILLVEDNPVNQKLAHMVLTKGGYHVEMAKNGRDAIEKFTASPHDFDLILMDIQMPIMDGLEATRIIRKKGFDSVPIIALTAHALDSDRNRCLEAGMNDHITKPIKRELVYRLIEKYLIKKSIS